jgi:hypothetical protein
VYGTAPQALVMMQELLEALQVFASPSERFSLRFAIWEVYVALTQSPASSGAQVKPFLPVVYRLAELLTQTTDEAIRAVSP